MLWNAITDESNRIESAPITHRPLDGHHRVREEDEFIFDTPDTPAEPDEDLDEDFGDEGEWDDDFFDPGFDPDKFVPDADD